MPTRPFRVKAASGVGQRLAGDHAVRGRPVQRHQPPRLGVVALADVGGGDADVEGEQAGVRDLDEAAEVARQRLLLGHHRAGVVDDEEDVGVAGLALAIGVGAHAVGGHAAVELHLLAEVAVGQGPLDLEHVLVLAVRAPHEADQHLDVGARPELERASRQRLGQAHHLERGALPERDALDDDLRAAVVGHRHRELVGLAVAADGAETDGGGGDVERAEGLQVGGVGHAARQEWGQGKWEGPPTHAQ
ncbi:MAG: hypothetical protein H6730_14795 [Deltaproteobacteria bacterium]|nr:hypothetical protein [Deltaproteobacteria bacterium]